MKPSTIGILAQVLFFLLPRSAVCSQEGSATAISLQALKSTDWEQRLDAYERIKGDQAALKRADVRRALLELLDRENHVGREAREKNGEGYSEYLGELGGTVDGMADWHDPRDLCILAQSTYNPESVFATKLAVEGGTAVVPCLLKMARSPDVWDRYESIPVIEHLSAVTKVLQSSDLKEIQDTVIRGLKDTNVSVRQGTVNSVGKFGKPEMIPALEDIARSDPSSRKENGKEFFYIRGAATRAIQSIQERAKVK